VLGRWSRSCAWLTKPLPIARGSPGKGVRRGGRGDPGPILRRVRGGGPVRSEAAQAVREVGRTSAEFGGGPSVEHRGSKGSRQGRILCAESQFDGGAGGRLSALRGVMDVFERRVCPTADEGPHAQRRLVPPNHSRARLVGTARARFPELPHLCDGRLDEDPGLCRSDL